MLVSIAVFGLFHPTELWVRPATSQPIRVETGPTTLMLEGSRVAKFHLGQTGPVRVTSEFQLSIPGKIDRRFRGVLHIKPAAGELIAIIDMDLEAAVASVTAAESFPGAGLEALKAQAVVASVSGPAPWLRLLRHNALPVPAVHTLSRHTGAARRRRHSGANLDIPGRPIRPLLFGRVWRAHSRFGKLHRISLLRSRLRVLPASPQSTGARPSPSSPW